MGELASIVWENFHTMGDCHSMGDDYNDMHSGPKISTLNTLCWYESDLQFLIFSYVPQFGPMYNQMNNHEGRTTS